jgi:large subunit ribosomal protein L15
MSTTETQPSERIELSDLRPAPGSHRERKRIGRGHAAGGGKTAGRGQKGQKSRSGSHRMRAGFAGGQNPLQMQLGKQRGPHKKTSMPFGPFRTHTQGVNVRDLARRFEAGAEVTPETLLSAGVLRHLRHPVKILGQGDLTVPLTVVAHGFSASARQKIEAAGGTVVVLGGEEIEIEVVADGPVEIDLVADEPVELEVELDVEVAPEEAAADEPEA